MARNLRDRYASMTDVASDLARIAEGGRPSGVHHRKTQTAGRMALVAVGVLFGVGVAATAVTKKKGAGRGVTVSTAGRIAAPTVGVFVYENLLT
jgi:hypothetical protein